jgi:glyoxylase-like metal-dependent hydrolase (beta-lactamase superfamily II)
MSLIEAVEGVDVVRVRADNPGPLTLSGTNTWVVGRNPAWIVDPGPADDAHLKAVAEVAAARGGAGGIAVTHDHIDHVEGVPRLREILGGVPVGPGPLEVIPVPGHSDDHVVFVWRRAAFTGDAVLGEGSVFVQGSLGSYLDALRRLRAMDLELICPGHGPVVRDPAAKLDGYVAHRLERERRLLEALESGLRSEEDLLDAAWGEVPAALRPVAAITLQAHLEKLRDDGRLPR